VKGGAAALATAFAVALAAGCGGDEGGAAADFDASGANVFAAASLTEVFQKLAPEATFNFAGSDELALQIAEGAPADVYAAASPKNPDQLFAEELVEGPRVFATNALVLIVPADNPAGIESVADLGEPGVKLVVGAEGVPVGDYTRTVLEGMGESDVLENVVSNEDDVKAVVAKVAQGEADAGFVYVTDVGPVEGEVQTIELPEDAQARVEYPIAVVSEAENPEAAQAFVDLVLSDEGREALEAAGFGVP
jgi:molybdate transport system substrate-binding protein